MKILKSYINSVLGLLVCFLGGKTSQAQQTPSFPEYNYNTFIVNPAYAGLLPATEITLANAGFGSVDGSPRNLNFSFHTPIADEKMGIGVGIIRDEIGVTKTTNTFAAYSYKIRFDFKDNRPYWQNYEPGILSFGITAGIQQFQDDLLDLDIMNDIQFSQNINITIPTVGLGFLFNHSRFYIGIYAQNIIGTSLASEDAVNLEFPLLGYIGYRFFNNRFEDFMIKPNLLIKQERGAPILADFNTSISYRNQFELGAGYRTNSSFNLLAGIYLFESFRLIYHYNIATNKSPIGNTQGLVLSVRLGDGYN